MLNQILEKLEKIESMLKEQSVIIMTVEKTSEYLNISRSQMYKLTSLNLIPYYKPNGKIIYFKKSEIDEWVLKNRNMTKDEIEREANNYILKHKNKF
jgi:excisionase family DNA binding protein